MEDLIIKEVRKIREEHAERLGYDVEAIVSDFIKHENESQADYVSLPAKEYHVVKPAV